MSRRFIPSRNACRAIAVLLIAAVATPLFAQNLGQGSSDSDISQWRIFATLIFILILISIAWFLIKLRGQPLNIFQVSRERRIRVAEVARVSAQSSLCLVRFDDNEYLLAVTPHSTTVIEKKMLAVAVDGVAG
jgi:flagellar biogenesis protein FliO